MSEASFSLTELRQASKVSPANIHTITAADGVRLAYRRYLPTTPQAVVLFYHGGGAHSGAGYQFLGQGLQSNFDLAVYMPDIRGHGASSGPRGDTPSPKQVWDDITTFIQLVHAAHPQVPLFIGGHSSGAGLVLNYLSQTEHETAEGYLFLSPQLGQQAHIDRPALAAPFAKVDGAAFAAFAQSGGRAQGHAYAVQFNYPADVLKADAGLVASITVAMSVALIPSAPHQQFAQLDRPFGLWIGTEDELFLPEKVLAFASLAAAPLLAESEALSLPEARHLSILVNAHEAIGRWVTHKLSGTA